jgi:hypothetical protein
VDRTADWPGPGNDLDAKADRLNGSARPPVEGGKSVGRHGSTHDAP